MTKVDWFFRKFVCFKNATNFTSLFSENAPFGKMGLVALFTERSVVDYTFIRHPMPAALGFEGGVKK